MELPRKANKNTKLWFFNLFCNYIVCIIRKYLKYDVFFNLSGSVEKNVEIIE